MIKEPSLLNKNFNMNSPLETEVEFSKEVNERENEETNLNMSSNTKSFSVKRNIIQSLSKGVLIGLLLVVISLGGYYAYLYAFPKPLIEISAISADLDKRADYRDSQKEFALSSPHVFQSKISEIEETTDDVVVTANSYLIFNPETFQILLQENSSEQVQIASLTKLMTALIVIDNYEMDDRITLNKPLPAEIEWTLQLSIGDSLTVEDALNAMLMSSYNDLAYLFALNYPNGGYDGFIQEMNTRAQLYGMYETHYANSYGFDDPDNYSTAKDLAKILSIFIKNEHLMKIVSKGGESITITSFNGVSNQKIVYSTNYLLGRDTRVIGMKTGSTKQAGACFTGYFEMDSQSDYITILLGSEEDRFQETLDLVQYVEDNFK